MEYPVAILILEGCLDQIILVLNDQPFFGPICDVQLLSEARNFCFGICHCLLQICLCHVCDFEFQRGWLDDEYLRLGCVVFEVLVNHVDFCSSWFVKTLELTFAVYGTKGLKLFSQFPEVFARWGFDNF